MKPILFGRYRLLERIGSGGMAEVFRARPAAGGPDVAVKRLHPYLAEDPDFVAMFIEEARLSLQLRHPNIAEVYELGAVVEQRFLAIELVVGRDLRAVFHAAIERSGGVPIPCAVLVASQILAALEYAHELRGDDGRPLELVHRDVSLQNVLLGFAGQVKLIDFGIAKVRSCSSSVTEVGKVKGKYSYMSPEQVRGRGVDRRSDIFSTGIVLFELLTGSRLFAGSSTDAIARLVREAEVPNPRIINPFIPARLEEIVMKALSKQPEDRFQCASEMRVALAALARTDLIAGPADLAAWLDGLFPGRRPDTRARTAGRQQRASGVPQRAELSAAGSGAIPIRTRDSEPGGESQIDTVPVIRIDVQPMETGH